MRKYEFYSKLSCADIFAILSARIPYVKEDGLKLVYRRAGMEFYLIAVGTIPINGQYPFLGTVEPCEDGSVIRGRFGLPKSGRNRIFILMGMGVMLLLGKLFFGVPLAVMAVMLLLWYLLCRGMLALFQRLFATRQKMVLAFIEENLLH